MPTTHDDAICLRHREWSETSQTVTLLTRTHGLVHGLAKGSQRDKAPYSGGFEHLQLGELGFISKPDRDLAILTEWDLINPHPALRADYRAATVAMFACELTASLLAPFDPHPGVFTECAALLSRLSEPGPGSTPASALAAYLAVLLADSGHGVGVESPPERDDEIWAYDPAHASFRPDPDRSLPADDPFDVGGGVTGVWHIRGETIRALHALGSGGETHKPEGGDHWARLSRFLGACACYRASRRPASLEAFLRVTRF